MFHKFNDTSLITKFIKQLVASTYVPTVPTWKSGQPIAKDCIYINRDYILKAKVDWSPDITNIKKYISSSDLDYFDILSPYIEGQSYRNITSNYVSNVTEYDSETHKWFGDYLRMLRDFHDINLMPFYNCVNNVTSSKIRITDLTASNLNSNTYTGTIINSNTKEDNLTTYLVPIYFNTDYTIYINSSLPFQISAICYDGVNRVTSYQDSILQYNSSTFSKPILYKVSQRLDIGREAMYYRNYLTLIIQVPSNVKNIVVLEGNYINNQINYSYGYNHTPETVLSFDDLYGNKLKDYNSFSVEDIEFKCPVISPLTRNLENELVAFDDKLIEFLLLNVIHSDDRITDNIERIQTYATSYECQKLNGSYLEYTPIKGVWDNNLRVFLYDLMTKPASNTRIVKDIKTIGTTGYVDKDTETMVSNGHLI